VVPGGVAGLRELSEGVFYRSGLCDKSESRIKGVSVQIISIRGREGRDWKEEFQGLQSGS
jgi:hypothetical protein